MTLFSKISNIFKNKNQYFYWSILIFFGTIFCLTSLLNHYYFRTYAMDLGVFNHTIYQMAHFKKSMYMVGWRGYITPSFAGHFSPILYILTPFYWVFGSYGMLVLQIVSIIFGGMGIYKYAQHKGFPKENPISLLLVIHFFSMWGIYSALSYDFHLNVVASMFVPWLLLFYEKKQTKRFLIFFVLILLCKENMALWLVFIMVGLVVKNVKMGKRLLKLEIPLALFAAIYFVFVFAILMPSLSTDLNGQGNHQIHLYSHIGDSLSDVIKNLVTKPLNTFSLLYKNTLGDPTYDGIKQELHLMVLFSGGLALLYKPQYLIMLIPIYAQKLFSNRFGLWGINYQYSIEFLPIISIALIESFSVIKNKTTQFRLVLGLVLITILITLAKIGDRKSKWYSKINTAFNSSIHYRSDVNLPIAKINRVLNQIPKNAVVSSSSTLLPHICFRDKIYHFPNIKDADYVVIVLSNDVFPLDQDEFDKKIKELRKDNRFEIVHDKDMLLMLRRKSYKLIN